MTIITKKTKKSIVLFLLFILIAFAFSNTLETETKLTLELTNIIETTPENNINILIKAENNEELREVIKKTGGKIKTTTSNYVSIELPANKVESLASSDLIEKVQENRKYSMLLDSSLPQIKTEFAHNLNYTGKEIKIAVLDTGINLETEKAKSFTTDNTNDVVGHGTHIAEIIKTIAPDTLLYNAKVLDDSGNGYTDTILEGIEWAINNQVDIISMSFGAPFSEPDSIINEELERAKNSGITVVISAGNCGEICPDFGCGSYRGITTPGDSKDAITVGAVNNDNEVACFSSGGIVNGLIKPDVVAPGVDITTATATKSGTSMAAPHVSASIALLLEKEKLTPLEIKDLLETNSIDLGTPGKDIQYGSGLINLEKLFQIEEEAPEITIAPVENSTNSTEGIRYNFTSAPKIIEVNYKEEIKQGELLTFNLNIEQELNTNILISNPEEEITELNSLTFENTNLPGKYEFKITTKNPYGEDIYNGKFIVKERIEPFELSSLILEDINDFKFIAYEEETNVDQLVKNNYKAVYENNGLFEIQELIFEDNTKLREYLYRHYPLRDNLNLIQSYKNYNVIDYDNKLTWFNNKKIYKVNNEELMKFYLIKIPSYIKEDLNQTIKVLKSQEITLIQKQDHDYNGTFVEFNIEEIDNSPQEITIEDENGTYTIMASCSDYSNTLGPCTTEGSWMRDNDGYPYGVYKCKDMIWIGTFLCWELQSEEGDDDYCSLVYDHTPYACSHHFGDCDWDYQCYSGMECVDGDGALTTDGCCYSNEGYDGDYCYQTCEEGYLNDYTCSGDTRYRLYQYDDCSTSWEYYETCDDDYASDWGNNYCSGSTDIIKHNRQYYTEYCDSSYDYCKYTSAPQTETVTWNGQGDYCDKALGICTCREAEGDCDVIGGDECASGFYCDVNWLGGTEYCCPNGEKWDGSSCIEDCDTEDYSQCYSGNRWWYDSCDNREYERENCGGKGCLSDECLECSSDSHCGSYEKCVDHTCVDKTCSDFSKPASCSYVEYVAGNTYCHPSEPEGDPVQCQGVGNTYCYDFIDYCNSEEYCEDPTWGGGAQCFAYECEITSSYWDRTDAIEGTTIHLIAEGEHCDGKTAAFDIWESDCPGFDIGSVDEELIQEQALLNLTQDANYTDQNWKDTCSSYKDTVTDTSFSSGIFDATWPAEYEDDIIGNPDYYFNVKIDGTEEDSSNNYLRVSEACYDNDNDGYGNPASSGCTYDEEDCDDNDIERNPGRTEVCDLKDNDCDGLVDEDDICNQNVCNDRNYESADVGCDLEQEMECRDIYHQSTAYEFSWGDSEKTDYCIDFNTVNEAYIDCSDFLGSDDTKFEEIDCPSGYVCSNGACIVETCEYNCVDSCIPDTNREGGCFLGDVNSGTCRLGKTCCNQDPTPCPVVCGDGICDSGEVCETDCYSDIKIKTITNVRPTTAEENEEVIFTVEVKNEGVIHGTRFIEAAVAPESWAGDVYPDTFRFETVRDNPFPICGENTYYDSKIVELDINETELVTFSIIAPNKDSVDECDTSRRSAWDTEFRIIVGTYEHVSGGEGYEKFISTEYSVEEGPEICEHPYGTSFECSCPRNECNDGFKCDLTGTFGECIEIINEDCDYLPDGSSEYCQCHTDTDCTKYNTNTRCLFRQNFNPCIPLEKPDNCNTVDELKCIKGDLHRCEQTAEIKDWILLEMCTYNQICNDEQKDCIDLGGYDLIVDDASSNIEVNKQMNDILVINVKTKEEFGSNIPLEYDQNNFELITGSSCENNYFTNGDNICIFRVDSVVGRSYTFKFGNEVERINIIKDPFIAYLTNKEQLQKRYNDDKGVNLLFSKLYEKALDNNGVVYDLDIQFKYNDYYSVKHPFNFRFNDYSENRINPRYNNNNYSESVAVFTQEKLSSTRNIVIVGDDYVIPHKREHYTIRAGSLPPGLRGTYNTLKSNGKYLGGILGAGISGPIGAAAGYVITKKVTDLLPNDIVLKNMYSDQNLVQRSIDFSYENLDKVFRNDESTHDTQVKLILPPTTSEEMDDSLLKLKQVLKDKGLVNSFDYYEVLDGNTLNCNDFNEFGDWWLFDPLDLPIIIGTPETNEALNCYPIYSGGDMEDIVTLEPSIWNGNGAAIVMNTNDPNVVSGFAETINSGEYKNLHGRGYMYFHDGITAVSIILIPVTMGASSAAAAGTISYSTLSAIITADYAVTLIDAADNCIMRDYDSTKNKVISCALSTIPAAVGGLADLHKAAKLKRFSKLGGSAGKSAVGHWILSSGDNAVADVLAKVPADLHPRLSEMLIKNMDLVDNTKVGSSFAKRFTNVIKGSSIRQAVFQKNPELVELIGYSVKNVDDEAIEEISKIISRNADDAAPSLSIIKKSEDIWTAAKVNELRGFSDEAIKYADEITASGKSVDLLTVTRETDIGLTKIKMAFSNTGEYLDALPSDMALLSKKNTIRNVGKIIEDSGEDIIPNANSLFSAKNHLNPPSNVEPHIIEDTLFIKNNADEGIIAIRKSDGSVLPTNSEKKFDTSMGIENSNAVNVIRESDMGFKFLDEGYNLKFIHNINGQFPDMQIFTLLKNNKIKILGNTGPKDSWDKIGRKLQTTIDSGYEFENKVTFYLDHSEIDLNKFEIEESIEAGLENTILGTRTKNSIDVLINEKITKITFKKKEMI